MQQKWEMNAHQALRLLRRQGLASRQDARQMKSVLRHNSKVPPNLFPLCQRLWLAQLPPLTRSLH